ncbi:MAG: PIN domain-containing protein [bacterium]
MPGYLLDTNVLICWFGKREGHKLLKTLVERPETELYTSVLCVAEFLSGCSSADENLLREAIESGEIEVVPFAGLKQAQMVASFRKVHGLKTPDAIVAAAADERNITLFTLDSEFSKKLAGVVKVYEFNS